MQNNNQRTERDERQFNEMAVTWSLFPVVLRVVPSSHSSKWISSGPVGVRRAGVPAQEGDHSGRADELQHCRPSGTCAMPASSSGWLDSREDHRGGKWLFRGSQGQSGVGSDLQTFPSISKVLNNGWTKARGVKGGGTPPPPSEVSRGTAPSVKWNGKLSGKRRKCLWVLVRSLHPGSRCVGQADSSHMEIPFNRMSSKKSGLYAHNCYLNSVFAGFQYLWYGGAGQADKGGRRRQWWRRVPARRTGRADSFRKLPQRSLHNRGKL